MSWSAAEPVDLPNNNSGLTVVEMPGGIVGCVHNPVADNWGARFPLVLSTTRDNGSTWLEVVTIEDGRTPVDANPSRRPGPPRATATFVPGGAGVSTTGVGEYSYPAAVRDGTVTVTYTWQRRGVVEAAVPIVHATTEGPWRG